jgi:hypothetical protein
MLPDLVGGCNLAVLQVPVIRVAAEELHGGTVTAHDNSVAVTFDFVDPVGTDRWF